eukprot:7397455-Alexandrium_andersonii.AAC.1
MSCWQKGVNWTGKRGTSSRAKRRCWRPKQAKQRTPRHAVQHTGRAEARVAGTHCARRKRW